MARLRVERLGVRWAEELASLHPLAGEVPALPVDATSVVVADLGTGLTEGEMMGLALACHRAAARRWRELCDSSASRMPGATP